MTLKDLKNKYPGEDIYVLGSGATLNFIDPVFYENKIVICVNHTINHVPKARKLYLVAKEPTSNMQKAAAKRNAVIVTCEHHSGLPKNPLNKILFPERTAVFVAKQNVANNPDQSHALERSSSTIASGIHLAAFMGAKNIILIGHDCGVIDGQHHVSGYSKEKAVTKSPGGYVKWMNKNKVEAKTMKLKGLLKKHFGANVYSLNPFINLGLEGHVYKHF